MAHSLLSRSNGFFSVLIPLLLGLGMTPAFAGFTNVAAQQQSLYSGLVTVEHVAVLSTHDNGGQTLTFRNTCISGCPGFTPGARLGGDVTLDGSMIWGPGIRAVDIAVSSVPLPERDYEGPFEIPTPDRALVLLENGHIVELRGIWGDGTAIPDPHEWIPQPHEWIPDPHSWIPNPHNWIPQPHNWIVHDTSFDTITCGKATALGEGARSLDAPPAESPSGFRDPVFLIGTEAGCVGQVRFFPQPHNWIPQPHDWFPQPHDWYPQPHDWIPNPHDWIPANLFDGLLIATGGLVSVGAGQVTELTLVPRDCSGTGCGREDFVALVGGELVRIDVKQTSVANGQATALASWHPIVSSEPGIVPLSVDGHRPQYADNGIIVPGGLQVSTPMVAADGTVSVYHGQLSTFADTLDMSSVGAGQVTELSKPVSKVALGSLWAISNDGQDLIYLPEYNPINGDTGSAGEVAFGGIHSVELGSAAFNLDAKGKFYTAVIEAGGDDISDIVADSVTLIVGGLGDSVDAELSPVKQTLVDRDSDGNNELVSKFSRSEVKGLLEQLDADGREYAGMLLSWDYTDVCDVDELNNDVPCRGWSARVVKIVSN